MRGGCGACGRSRKPLPGGFGHHVRRYYGRCAGCCRWTGTGAKRVTPPRAASQETWPGVEKPRPRNLGQSRGGAPEGERADRKARAASERCGSSELRLSALRLPSLLFGGKHVGLACAKLGRGCVARTRSLFFPPPRSGGGGPLELAQRANRGGGAPSFVVGAGGLQRWSCIVLLESKRASLMSAHVDNFLAACEASAAPSRGRSRRRRRSGNFSGRFLPVHNTR